MHRRPILCRVARSRARPTSPARRAGFTLIEVLVVVAIIVILIAMLLPAVQAVRESGNRAKCSNSLHQFGIGMMNHHTGHFRYPTGGWGWFTVGDPDKGTGKEQPGGWAYNLLPYVEQDNLHNLGMGQPPAQKANASSQRLNQAIDMFYCPSRRPPLALPNAYGYSYMDTSPTPQMMGRSDYAANCGDQNRNEIDGGSPANATQDLSGSYSGIFYRASVTSIPDIVRGASNTYMIGEKYLNVNNYTTGTDGSDNENMYTGFNNDIYRSTVSPPLRDQPGYGNTMIFGGPHRSGVNMLYCDGAVKFVTYGVDPIIHRDAGRRK